MWWVLVDVIDLDEKVDESYATREPDDVAASATHMGIFSQPVILAGNY